MDLCIIFPLILIPNLAVGQAKKSAAFGKECARFMCEYKISEQITNIQNENGDLEERIAKLEKQQKHTVSAYVRLSKSLAVTSGQRVKYDTEVSNIGGAYNFQKGQFTAPVGGIYLIHVTVCVPQDSFMNLEILKNSVKVGVVRVGDRTYIDCSSGGASVHLEANDHIWVERADPSSGTGLFEGRGWNTFAVTLLHADPIN